MNARDTLLAELRDHALLTEEASPGGASYGIDVKRAILRQPGFRAVAELVARYANTYSAQAVGGMTPGADAVASAALSDRAGQDLLAFLVRAEVEHGLHRWIEGPLLEEGTKVLIVEDVVTTGGSTVKAIGRCQEEGLEIVGTVCVLDRLAGGAEAIEAAGGGPFTALATIDQVYPDRDDR